MRKIFLTIIVLFAAISTGYSQLNRNASLLKENGAEEYEKIKTFAEQDWKGDHSMMVHTINKQADALFEFVEITKEENYDKNILITAMSEWNKEIDGVEIFDYVMIVHIYRKELKAKSQY